jgi:uncharacterized membrane protein
MSVVALYLVIYLLVALPLFIWWLVCLIQALKVPDSSWAAADQNKLVYILLMVFLGVIGTIVYAVVARPALRSTGASI